MCVPNISGSHAAFQAAVEGDRAELSSIEGRIGFVCLTSMPAIKMKMCQQAVATAWIMEHVK
jgi:hypothetical protein